MRNTPFATPLPPLPKTQNLNDLHYSINKQYYQSYNSTHDLTLNICKQGSTPLTTPLPLPPPLNPNPRPQ